MGVNTVLLPWSLLWCDCCCRSIDRDHVCVAVDPLILLCLPLSFTLMWY
jgi:hypothetical protein